MKKTLIVLVAIAAICTASWQIARSQHTESSAESVDESKTIVAEYSWNGTPYQISLADLKAAISELPIYRQENYASKEGKAEYLAELIDEKLKILAATEQGLDKNEEFLKKAEDYKHQLMVERITEIEVDQKVAYTEDDLKAYYEAHKGEYIEAANVRTTCIGLQDEDIAQDAMEQINVGKDIIEMAKELSEKGELRGPGSNSQDPGNTGPFTKDASRSWQAFIDAVFEQEVGETTEDVFEIDIGDDQTFYLIFRKEEHNQDRQKEFDEVTKEIEREVEREKKRERINNWVTEITTQGNLKTYAERIPEPPPVEEEAEDSEAEDQSETPEPNQSPEETPESNQE